MHAIDLEVLRERPDSFMLDAYVVQLATAEGDLTENIELIENLEESKRVATEISKKAVKAAENEIAINETRESYRPASTRAALLFFLLVSLGKMHSLYIYSLWPLQLLAGWPRYLLVTGQPV